jgi:hypothetical protein
MKNGIGNMVFWDVVMLFVRLGNTQEEPAASIIRVTFNLLYPVDGGSRFL